MKLVSFGDVSALKGCVSLEKGLLLLSLQGRHLFNKKGQLYFRWCYNYYRVYMIGRYWARSFGTISE